MKKALAGSTVLLLGVGGIGAEVARLCKAFGMHTIGLSRSRPRDPAVDEAGTIAEVRGFLPRADFVVDAALVSRLHCRITAAADNLEVVDLKSTNGTFVNGKRVQKAHLTDGDRLREELKERAKAEAAAIVSLVPTHSKTTSAPAPPVSSRMWAATLPVLASSVTSAPSCRARASLVSRRPTAMTRAPLARASWISPKPTPPTP